MLDHNQGASDSETSQASFTKRATVGARWRLALWTTDGHKPKALGQAGLDCRGNLIPRYQRSCCLGKLSPHGSLGSELHSGVLLQAVARRHSLSRFPFPICPADFPDSSCIDQTHRACVLASHNLLRGHRRARERDHLAHSFAFPWCRWESIASTRTLSMILIARLRF